MINQLKTISKETLIYGIGNAATSLVSFLLLPLYTKFLTPGDYGYLIIFTIFQSIIEITAIFGLSSGLFRYYLMAKDGSERSIVISTCFWTQTLFVCLIAAIALPLSSFFSQILFGSAQYSSLIRIVIATAFLSAFGNFILSFMRAKRKPVLFAAVQLIKVALLTLTNIYFVAVLHWNYSGILIGNLTASAIVTVIVLIWFSRFIGFSFSLIFFKKLIYFVSPLYLVNVFYFLLNLSDRFFLNHFLTATEVGLYSFGNKIGSVVLVGIITPFSTAIVPYALSIVKEDHFKKTFANILKYFFLLLVYSSLCIFYFSKEIVLIVSNKSYINASGIVGPILLSSIFYGLYYSLSIAIDIVEKTYLATIVVIIGALVSVGLNYSTIPIIGIYGSALAACVSNFVLLVLMYYFCQKNFFIKYDLRAFMKVIGIVILYIALYYGITLINYRIEINYSIKITMCILFPVLLFILKIFDAKEREYAINYLRRNLLFSNR